MAHAYVLFDEPEAGIARADAFAASSLGIPDGPDRIVLRYGLFSVEDARALADIAQRAPLAGDRKAVIVCATRFFHEAQNALLKLFEEPPAGTTLLLILPAEGMLLPTLRSRLARLPDEGADAGSGEAERAFLSGTPAAREKIVAKLLDRAKSDKDEEKQAARAEAVRLAEACVRAAEAALRAHPAPGRRRELLRFQDDLHAFLPVLHERSAPLKPIFEHLLLVCPEKLGTPS